MMEHPVDHGRAAAWLAAHALLLALSLPGFETLQSYPPKGSWVASARAFDAAWRGPIEAAAEPVERLFGVRQAWQFYRTGASEVRRFEVHVDGELWHRSLDPAHRFDHAALANPRMRHIVKDWVRGKGAAYGPGLHRYVVARVLAVKPNAQHVRITGLEGRWPGREMHVSAQIEGAAPGFVPRKIP
jgi:hypothetical protein